jgi:hypothetical protein
MAWRVDTLHSRWTVTASGAYSHSHSLPSGFEPKVVRRVRARRVVLALVLVGQQHDCCTVFKRALTALAATAYRRYT